ncbi:MAG: NAD(P)/FAD-dependent oxidoreductase [Labilithrix sp.]|nr:NAD(P)/FAD-dependent oxidoreductase [Labilithrix sp.]MCW5813186.1 NAD(P)/FAD-dependent oxidoreductase [Labilithrix sp.]
MFDVLIVGGSYAGMSAALQLGRARRKVLVVDAGVRRNRFAAHAHGLLGRDGVEPAVLAAQGRRDVEAYPTVTWLEGEAASARKTSDGFALRLASGEEHHGRLVVLALGVTDELPDLPGLRERWGKSVFHCPYCHGYELGMGKLGCLATSPMSIHQAAMLPDWGETTYFTNGAHEPAPEELALLERRGVHVEREPVAKVGGAIDVTLASGRTLSFAGLFAASQTRPSSPLAEELGCELEQGPMGPFIKTDAMKETTVPGVFACGDAAIAAGAVPFAIGDGFRAGTAAHRSLMFG